MKTIRKKILPEYFQAVADGTKTFELRKDDSDYKVGDFLELREWDADKGEYTGRVVVREITYILRNVSNGRAEPGACVFGLDPGYCAIGIKPVGWRTGSK